jgi:hypothetical protein
MHDITTFALSLSGLAHELQRERDLSAGYMGSGKTSGYGRMIAQRVAVNQALKGFQGKLRRTDLTPYSQGLQARFRPPRRRWPASTGSGTGSAPTSRSPWPRRWATTTT